MKEIYVESYDNIEGKQGGTIKNSVDNMPIKEMRYVFILIFLAVFYITVIKKTYPISWLLWTIAGLVVIIALLGFQNKDMNSHITHLEAKALLLRDLRFLKRSGTREFDGLNGVVETYGECYHDNSASDNGKWVWIIGWRHILPNRRQKYYTAQIYSKMAIAKVRALSESIGRYMGEEVITGLAEKAVQSGPREVNYYVSGNNDRRPIF